MDAITIRRAEAPDATRLNTALASLSADLGDKHRATDADVREAGYGPAPSFTALLAERGDEVIGVVMFSPLFSTTRGGTGAFVSDLWVAEMARGDGLGRCLLAKAAETAHRIWGALFLKLSVHRTNAEARAAYERIGFAPIGDETTMILAGDSFQLLKGRG